MGRATKGLSFEEVVCERSWFVVFVTTDVDLRLTASVC